MRQRFDDSSKNCIGQYCLSPDIDWIDWLKAPDQYDGQSPAKRYGKRQMTIEREDRASRSIADHRCIIEALEPRGSDADERLSREATLGLVGFVETHADRFD